MIVLSSAVIAEPVPLSTAQYALWAEDNLPDERADWRTIQLPFISGNAGLLQAGNFPDNSTVWFRFVLPTPADHDSLSLLLWRYNLSGAVFFNGEEIASNGHRAGYTTMAWNRPLLANIGNSTWRADDLNEILIRLDITRLGGTLAPVLLGPRDQLESIYAGRLFRQVEINRILLAFALSIGFFTFALWLMRRQDNVYLWFSAVCVSWAIASSHTVIYYNLIPFTAWIPIVHIAMDVCTFCIYGFIGRLAGARKPGRERLLLAWVAAASIINLSIPPQWFWQTTYLMHLVSITALGIIVVRVALIALRKKQTEAIIITLAILAQIGMFVLNAFQMFFSNGDAWDDTLVFAHFGLPVMLLIFSAVLLRRFTEALQTAETLNRELEQKVEESRQIIARSFEERRVLEMKQAAEQERLKIYRDLHDDVGSRLLSIIHADSDNRLGNMARAALESLRQAVSKANTPDQPLSQLLGDIREETELRLRGSGHDVIWIQEALEDVIIPSEIAFNLNRIMKELVSNIIRHAQATMIQLEIKRQQSSVVISVNDNGSGFQPGMQEGNGLRNIRSRAAEIHAQLDFFSNPAGSHPAGTRTRLVLPVWHDITDRNMTGFRVP